VLITFRCSRSVPGNTRRCPVTWLRFGRRQLLGGIASAVGGLAVSVQSAAGDEVHRRRGVRTLGTSAAEVPTNSGPLLTVLLPVPVRVYDSRAGLRFEPNGTDPTTGATDIPWVNGTERALDVECVLGDPSNPTGVSTTASGVLMNITVTNIKAGGRLVVWADGPRPGTSNMNWTATSGVVNSLVMSRCLLGYVRLCTVLTPGSAVDVIVDVVGWLEPAA
jgi:hypothetical protein